ncbi:hypothetical protein COV61_01775 [Candidatus Micrarchaeota archaeon CG11_big_fil_rev_8_21_14_0_20_47_5]|nr:MAG: hypothetical protein AUJ17_02135 [Candidatus Micrarchaeota archaeon CG1_02_47_40]PIN83895.1 MAG: hypothetical protein COV61_01775 [Candidatus Micrarchaeota archaeon CG11_big_fil_rev_8_21_14_0_20_47_5]
MSDVEGSFLTSPLAMLVSAIIGLIVIIYAVSAVIPFLLGGGAISLSPPTDLKAEAIAGGIKITWEHPFSPPDHYVLYKSGALGALGNKAGEIPSRLNSFIDLQVSAGSTYYYIVRSADADGNEEQNTNQVGAAYISAFGEEVAPSAVTLKLNNNAKYANTKNVTISLAAVNADKCRFKNEECGWSAWEAFTPAFLWQLSDGDGAKEVSVECMNPAGVTSAAVSSSITLDTIAPKINVSKAALIPNTRKFNMSFTISDSTSQKITCKSYINGIESDIQSALNAKQSLLFTALATKNTLYLVCTDEAGNSARSLNYTFEVSPSLLANGTSIKIENDAPETRSITVSLSLFSQDAYECRLKNTGENFIEWEPYATSRSWTLTYGNGYKSVYYQCRDYFGQIVGDASDDIVLIRPNDGPSGGGGSSGGGEQPGGVSGSGGPNIQQINPPSNLSVEINNGIPYTSSQMVTLRLYASGASECRYSNNNGSTFSPWEAYNATKEWNLTAIFGGGWGWETGPQQYDNATQNTTYNVTYQCKNTVGSSGQVGDSVIYSPTQPVIYRLLIDEGAEYTQSFLVDLKYYAINAQECRCSNDGGATFCNWKPYGFDEHFQIRDWDLRASFPNGNDPSFDNIPQTPPVQFNVSCMCRNSINQTPLIEDSILYSLTPPTVQPPSSPAMLTSVPLVGGRIELSWQGKMPASGGVPSTSVIKYNIYRRSHTDVEKSEPSPIMNFANLFANSIFSDYLGKGEYEETSVYYKIGEASSLSWVDSRAINGLKYDYTVKAENANGQESEESNKATATADSLPPEVFIYEPDSLQLYTTNIPVSFRVSDNVYPIMCTVSASRTSEPQHTFEQQMFPNIPPDYGKTVETSINVPEMNADYSLEISCTDLAGNSNSQEAEASTYTSGAILGIQQGAGSGSSTACTIPAAMPVFD